MASQGEEIAAFLRARYREAREREHAKHRVIPSVFDGHSVEWVRDSDGERLLVDGHAFPVEKWREIATAPDPDPDVLADLDAKLAIVGLYETAVGHVARGQEMGWPHNNHQVAAVAYRDALLRLALPFAAHPDYDERWRP